MTEWISVKDKHAPQMQTVLLAVDGDVISGWNEAVHPREDPLYCSWEPWPDPYVSGDGVTHWMEFPEPPKRSISGTANAMRIYGLLEGDENVHIIERLAQMELQHDDLINSMQRIENVLNLIVKLLGTYGAG